MHRSRHRNAGLVSAIGGTLLVFALVIGINEFAERDAYDDRKAATEFEVAVDEPRPEPIVEPPPPREPEPLEPPRPVDLASEVGSVDVPVPGLDFSEIDAVVNEVDDSRDLIMTDDTVDTPPQPLQRVAAEYPSRARRDGLEGFVTLSLLIDHAGDIQRVQVLDAEPAGVFDEAAALAIRQWRFEPARYRGEAVRVWARQRITFQLN